MRIALFSDTWLPNINGVVTSLLNQIRVLQEDGNEVFLFVPKTGENKLEKVPEGITIYEFPGLEFPSYPGYKMSFPTNLRKIMRTQRFDILHSHSPFLQGWICFMVRHVQNAPMVTTYHTHLVEYIGHIFRGIGEEYVKHFLYGFMWTFTRNQYNKYDVIFTPSRVMKLELEHYGLHPVIELPNPITGIFLENQTDIELKKRKFRETFNIPEHSKILLYVGRISFEKRIEILLEAYRNLEQKYSDIFLLIVGDGPQIGMYKRKAKSLQLKNYFFTGYIQHGLLPIIYQMGDVFISASNTETQGLTFLEAMSQGCPVIAIKARGPADYIVHNINGLFANNLLASEFQNLIEQVLDNPQEYQEIKRNATRTASKFNYNNFRKRLYSGYDEAISRWEAKNNK